MKINFRNILTLLLIWTSGLIFSGCPYSFTGASLPSNYRSVAIPVIDDLSGTGESGLRENLTEKIRTKFLNDNTLKLADKKYSDLLLEGAITAVRDETSAISGNEKVSTRRVTLSVKFQLFDQKAKKKLWDKSFSNWGDYEAGSGGVTNRQVGFKTAIDKLTEDILIGTVSDW